MHYTTSFLALAAALPSAFAHYNFERLIVNGQQTEPYEYVRALGEGVGNGPFYDVSNNDIRCNNGSFGHAAETKTMKVKAGDTLGFTIRDVLGHPGPLFAYMSKSTTDDVSTYEGDGDWFKIYEMGVKTYANYEKSMTWLSDGWKEFNFTIPTAIEDGQYLLRAEHIAIHSAGGDGPGEGAQFYIGCAQIEVSGGAGGTPSPVGKFPGIYNKHDPGIWFNPYWPPVVNYTMPGLEVYPEGGSFPPFTANPDEPVATQPLPATFTGGLARPTGGAGAPSNNTASPTGITSAPVIATSAPVSAAPLPSANSTLATIVAVPSSAIPAPSSAPSAPSDNLPKEFTVKTFIQWLQSQVA